MVTPQQQRYFNTTTPFSTVAYKKGFVSGHEENDIDFLFTGNLNKRPFVQVTGEQKIDIVFFMPGYKPFLIRYGGERGGGVEITLLLRRDHVRRQTPCKRIVYCMLPVIDDAAASSMTGSIQ